MSATDQSPKGRLASIWASIWDRTSLWIRTNLTGDDNTRAYTQSEAKPHSVDEELRSTMEQTEFMPPDPFTGKEDDRHKFVEFWVKKALDAVVSAIGGAFAWLFFRMTGFRLIDEAQAKRSDMAEAIVPFAVWVACFLILSFRRRARAGNGK
jgi:hypothetical protein